VPGGERAASGDGGTIEIRQLPEVAREGGREQRLLSEELVRGALAIAFTVVLIITVVFSFLHSSKADWPQTKELLQLLLPAETALLGSAVGFYYGSRK
jgi:hypothetical protein